MFYPTSFGRFLAKGNVLFYPSANFSFVLFAVVDDVHAFLTRMVTSKVAFCVLPFPESGMAILPRTLEGSEAEVEECMALSTGDSF